MYIIIIINVFALVTTWNIYIPMQIIQTMWINHLLHNASDVVCWPFIYFYMKSLSKKEDLQLQKQNPKKNKHPSLQETQNRPPPLKKPKLNY